jgi:hypothetical protein
MTTRQQLVDEIRQQIITAGFTLKDFLLTQAPAPDKKDKVAYGNWKRREARRRPIARRLYHHGFTAHDLVQDSSSKPNVISPRG